VSWKPVGTSWVHCRLWIIFPPMYPPITSGVHLECNLNMCPACIHQITFKMLSKMFLKCSQHMCRKDVPMCPTCCSIVYHVLSMFSKQVACSHNIPTGHMAGSFLEHQWQPCWMFLVITCWTHVEVTFQMYPRCDWWIHWGENDPEPAMFPQFSHWFPGHLTPSV